MSHSVILQHSEPYSRVDITQLWQMFSLVLVLYWEDLHTLLSFWRRFWPCWEGSWCHSQLLHHALLCCPGKWALQSLAGLLRSLKLVWVWTRSAVSLMSSFGWSSGQLAVRKCWVGSSFPACVIEYGRPRQDHLQNLGPLALRRGSNLCPVTDLLLCASLSSQYSCWRASPTLHSLVWRQSSLQSWFHCCLLCMWSCCRSFWWCR